MVKWCLIYQCLKIHTKNGIDPNFWFVFEHTKTFFSSFNFDALKPIFINVFFKKEAYGKYLSFGTLESYVACLGAKLFKFLGSVTFGEFLAEDEQRPKLVSAHPKIP